MKYKNRIFLCLALSISLLSAFQPWGPGDILSSSPWTRVQTWNDFDTDGVFVMDTVECTQDNQWIFLPSGNLLITEQTLKCESDIPLADTIRGQWTLENEDKQVKFSFTGGGEKFYMTIEAIEANQAIFSFSGSNDANDQVVRQRIVLRR